MLSREYVAAIISWHLMGNSPFQFQFTQTVILPEVRFGQYWMMLG